MSKIFFSLFLLCAVSASFGDVQVSNTLSELKNGSDVQKLRLSGDDGYSNWGDLVHKNRQSGDRLLYRGLIVLPDVSGADQTWHHDVVFDGDHSFTSVRFLNVGRQRAFGDEIDIGADRVRVVYTVPAQKDPRIIVEIYGSA